MIDLKKFEFPIGTERLFTNKYLLQEAKDRGFYNGNTPYNILFSNLFYSGGKVVFKKYLDEQFKEKAWKYCRSFMGSFEPKHEHKEAICALLISELLEPNLEK